MRMVLQRIGFGISNKKKLKNMNEKLIDRKLCEAVKKLGGLAVKLWSPTFTGMPDRLILLPGGKVCFAEFKSTGKVLKPRQKIVIALLQKLGFTVFVIDDQPGLDGCVKALAA